MLSIAAIVLLPYLLYRLLSFGKREDRLPPGPPTKPVLGNLTDIPPINSHLAFAEFAKLYGSVFSLKLFHRNLVVLNDAKSVREILEVNANITSDRPPAYVVNDYMTENNHLLLVDAQRAAQLKAKLYNRAMTVSAVEKYGSLLKAESAALLHNILQNPANFYTEVRRLTASFTMAFAWGKRAPVFHQADKSGFSCEKFFDAQHKLNAMLEPGAIIPLDLLTWLKRLPIALQGWKPRADSVKALQNHLYIDCLYKDLLERMQAGRANDCWMAELVTEMRKGVLPFDERTISWSGGVMLEGGSDTTSSALLTILLVAVLHPEEVKKCQAEIDKVTNGADRSPQAEDMVNLPRTAAFIKECDRWRLVANGGVPHYSTADISYGEHVIPANTIIIQNNYAILHDENLYDEPQLFQPERFLHHPFGHKKGVEDCNFRSTYGFGSGRRQCGGMKVAQQTLYTAVPKLLWAFDWGFAKNADGTFNKPSPDAFIPGHLAAPVPFLCDIKPRSEAHAATIQAEYAAETPFYEMYEA